MPSDIPPEDVMDMALAAALRYRRRCWWADVRDLQAEAALAMCSALRWARPEGDMRGYLWRVAVVACRNALLRASAPVSAGKNNLDALRGLRRAPVGEAEADRHVVVRGDAGGDVRIRARPRRAAAPPADETLDRAAWEERVRSRLRVVLQTVPDADAARAVLLEDRKPREVAEEAGVPVRSVYHATRKAREVIAQDLELYELIVAARG